MGGHSGGGGRASRGGGGSILMSVQPDQSQLPSYADGWGKPKVTSEFEGPGVVNARFEIEHKVPMVERGKEYPYVTSHISGKINHDKKLATITSIGVDEHIRNRGVATALVREIKRNLPGYDVTTTGVYSPQGKSLFSGLIKKGLVKSPDVI